MNKAWSLPSRNWGRQIRKQIIAIWDEVVAQKCLCRRGSTHFCWAGNGGLLEEEQFLPVPKGAWPCWDLPSLIFTKSVTRSKSLNISGSQFSYFFVCLFV